MSRISTRVMAIAESATAAVEAKARLLMSQGRNVISFGAGEPDFATPAHIVKAAQIACDESWAHHYSAIAGLPALRDAIATRAGTEVGNVLVTNGAKQAVYTSFAVLLNEGDEALIPSPYWVTYPEAVSLAGGVPVAVQAGPEQGFRVSVDDLESCRTERTKLLVFVSPCNPTGAVYPPEEVAAIGRWAQEHEIWVVTDEIYGQLTYGAAVANSIRDSAGERCVVIDGVAKSYAMTGWRVGWMIAPLDVIVAATNLQSHLTSNVANVSQAAALAALTGPMDTVFEMREEFDHRRQIMVKLLSEIPGVLCPEPQGAFYCFPLMEAALPRTGAASTLDLAEMLLDRVEVAVVPGEAFGAPGFMRLSYALSTESLTEGLNRMAEFLS